MAPQSATCPHCQLEMDIPRNLRGQEIECPQCEKTFTPAEEPPPLPKTEEPPPLPVESEAPKPETNPGVATCPQCKLEMDVPPELRGQEVECPGCRKPFYTQEPEDAVQPRRRRRRAHEFDDDDDDDDYFRITPEQRTAIAMNRVKPIAITLIIFAALRLVFNGIIAIAGGYGIFENPAKGSTLLVFFYVSLVFCKEAVTCYGAWQMLNVRSYGWGLAASILLIVPDCNYCCWACHFTVYLALGIWGIIIINDYDVRWLIRQRQKSEREMDRHDS